MSCVESCTNTYSANRIASSKVLRLACNIATSRIAGTQAVRDIIDEILARWLHRQGRLAEDFMSIDLSEVSRDRVLAPYLKTTKFGQLQKAYQEYFSNMSLKTEQITKLKKEAENVTILHQTPYRSRDDRASSPSQQNQNTGKERHKFWRRAVKSDMEIWSNGSRLSHR